MCRALRFALLGALSWAACPLPSQQRPGLFTPASCAFEIPAGAQVRCGWLSVPEDRSKINRRILRLHTAIYKSRSVHPAPDPIVWVVGGPGGRAHRFASVLFKRVVEPYLGKRDFIVLDIRGTGYSQPALDCPDRSGPSTRWVPACRQSLSPRADLDRYHSADAAADLADLRRALGLREWNLLGESYGTRLALTILRDHPEGIRAVVLDSVVPPEVDEYADGPAKFESALNALFADCAADPACRTAVPDLRRALLDAADRLDRSPRRLAGSWHGRPLDVRFDGRQLLEGVHMALYESDLIPQLPRAISHATEGGADGFWTDVIGRHALFVGTTLIDWGAHLSFRCAEEAPFTDLTRLKAEDAGRPWMRQVANGIEIVDTCRLWRVRSAGRLETLPVRSDRPVLLLAGAYDPVTPPAYARSAQAQLPNSHLFVFPAMGHQLTANTATTCPQSIVLEFLDNPGRRPSAMCFDDWKPRWER